MKQEEHKPKTIKDDLTKLNRRIQGLPTGTFVVVIQRHKKRLNWKVLQDPTQADFENDTSDEGGY